MRFDPREISGLLTWLDADDTFTLKSSIGGSAASDTGTVAEWQDKSGNGNHASNSTGSNLPNVYYTSGVYPAELRTSDRTSQVSENFKPAGLYFSNDFLTFGTSLGRPADFTLFLTVTLASVTGAQNLCGSIDGGGSTAKSWGWVGNELGGTAGDGKIFTGYGDDTGFWYGESTNQQLYPYFPIVISLRHTDGVLGVEMFNRGDDLAVTGTSTETNNSGVTYDFALGQVGALASNRMAGWIHEFMVYDEALSDFDRASVEKYLSEKWKFRTKQANLIQVSKNLVVGSTGDDLKVNFPAHSDGVLIEGLASGGFAPVIKTPDGSQAVASNSVSEVGSGVYEVSLASAEVNAGGTGSLLVRHAQMDDVFVSLDIENPADAVWSVTAEDAYAESTIGGYINEIKKFVCNKITKSGGVATIYKDDESTTHATVDITASTRDPS